jgi:hypothetical protein
MISRLVVDSMAGVSDIQGAKRQSSKYNRVGDVEI